MKLIVGRPGCGRTFRIIREAVCSAGAIVTFDRYREFFLRSYVEEHKLPIPVYAVNCLHSFNLENRPVFLDDADVMLSNIIGCIPAGLSMRMDCESDVVWLDKKERK